MAGSRLYRKALIILLCVPTLVLADIKSLPLGRQGGPLPFDCAECHREMAQRLEGSAYPHGLPGNLDTAARCHLCHVDTGRGCRFTTVRDEEARYLHSLDINWPHEGRYQLRLRSRNTRGELTCPSAGAYVFDTRQAAPGPVEIESAAEAPGRLRISRLSLARLSEKWGQLRWETNLRADAEATYWPAEDTAHLPLKGPRRAGWAECRDCHLPDVWAVAHPVGVRLRPEMTGCDLPLGEGSEVICATCHDPHGSRQAYILRKDEDQLCRTCHRDY